MTCWVMLTPGIRRLREKGRAFSGRRQEEERDVRCTDRVDSRPLSPLTNALGLAEASAFLPVLEATVAGPRRLPEHLARVAVDGAREPSRCMRRKLSLLSLAAGLALVLVEFGLEVVRALELAGLESVLIGTKSAVGRREPRLEVVVDVVEGDGVGGEVEGHARRLQEEERRSARNPSRERKGKRRTLTEFFQRRIYSGATSPALFVGTEASGSSSPDPAPARRATSCDDHLPAISKCLRPLTSLTSPLISRPSPRHPRGLNVKVQVSPVRWLVTTMSP